MEKDKLKEQIMGLVEEASIIAPTIIYYEEDGSYGRVTDDNYDFDGQISWKMEAKSILYQLSNTNSELFKDLYKDYVKYNEESKKWHSKSIHIQKIRTILIEAFTLLGSNQINLNSTDKVNKITNLKIEKGYAFIAMPMDPEDYTLIDVLEAIKEAALECGVQAERIDEPQSNRRITDRIIESIQRAEFVIVDLSNSKPNVFFEAGYAHGFGKIPIYFAKHGTKLEFDLKDYPVLFYRNLKELKQSIKKRIKGLKPNEIE